MSVKIVDFAKRTNGDGETFNALILESDITMVQSKETNRFYATAKRTSITSTFDEATCRRLIGKEMPGEIIKQPCEPFEYTVPETGEVVELSHRYEYIPEGAPKPSMEKEVFDGNGVEAASSF